MNNFSFNWLEGMDVKVAGERMLSHLCELFSEYWPNPSHK